MEYNAKASELTLEAAKRLAALLEELGLNKRTARERALFFVCRARNEVESAVGAIGFN